MIRLNWFLSGSNADIVMIKCREDEKIHLLIRFKQIKHAQPTACLQSATPRHSPRSIYRCFVIGPKWLRLQTTVQEPSQRLHHTFLQRYKTIAESKKCAKRPFTGRWNVNKISENKDHYCAANWLRSFCSTTDEWVCAQVKGGGGMHGNESWVVTCASSAQVPSKNSGVMKQVERATLFRSSAHGDWWSCCPLSQEHPGEAPDWGGFRCNALRHWFHACAYCGKSPEPIQ